LKEINDQKRQATVDLENLREEKKNLPIITAEENTNRYAEQDEQFRKNRLNCIN